MGRYGIDISEHNGNIDLSPYKYVIIRAGWGLGHIDKKFYRNVKECDRLGIKYGVYWYSYALDNATAKKEVQHFISTIKGCNVQLGAWLDMEDADGWKKRNGWTPDKSSVSAMTCTYCSALEAAGYYAGVYLSYSWLRFLDSTTARYDKWVAHWGPNDGKRHGDYKKYAAIHQFTSTPLDRDYFYITSFQNPGATVKPSPTKPAQDIDTMALGVLFGDYGNGETRKQKLGADYDRVQRRVNEILRLARDTMNGKYGNDPERKRKLGADYKAVQAYINWLLEGTR